MKKVILLIVLSFSYSYSNSQTFENAYLDIANSTVQLGGLGTTVPVYNNIANIVMPADSGFLMIGNETNPTTAESDILLVKTDLNGSVEWKKYFGGSGNDFSRAAIQTADGGFLITGGTNTAFAGGMDVQLIKIDSAGNEMWTKTYGGAGDEEGLSLHPTADGGYIIAGKTNSYGAGNEDVYLLKTDAAGDLLWSKTFGGANTEYGNAVFQANDGGYFIAGQTKSFGAGNWDVYMIKTDASGNETWAKTVGGTGSDIAKAAVQTEEGEFVIAGSGNSYGDMDMYLFKLSSNGTAIWAKTFGGNNYDAASAVCQTGDGGYLITGQTESFGAGSTDVYLVKTSSGGTASWTKTYGTSEKDAAYCSVQLADGGYVTTGSSVLSGGSEGFYLVRSDENGNTNCSDNNTATIIASVSLQIVDASLTSATAPAAISSTYAATLDITNMLTTDARCTLEVAPENGANDSLVTVMSPAHNSELFEARSIEAESTVAISVYPNPSAGQFNFSGLESGCRLEIYSVSGELVLQQTVSNEIETIDLTGKTKGFYFYRITGLNGKVQQAKIIIQ